MNKKAIIFGARDYEIPYFSECGINHGYEVEIHEERLDKDNLETAKGYEIVVIRSTTKLNYDELKYLKDNGLKYYLTATKGYDHIDLKACQQLGIKVAYVPNYSPNSVSELALTFTMMLLRNVAYSVDESSKGRFVDTPEMFSKEIRECTVGILGCGRIGVTTAKLFKGLGAKVIGYDIYQSPEAKEIIEFKDEESFFKEADVIICHMAYFKGENDHFISKEKIDSMKDGSIIVNVARGALLDTKAAIEAVKSNHLKGLAMDVIEDESNLFGHTFDPKHMPTPLYQDIVDLYPRVLVTPHVGGATDLAAYDMAEVTYQNADEYLETGNCKNSLI